MNEDVVIDVKNISKKYTISTGYQSDTLRDKLVELAQYPLRALTGHKRAKTKEYWALKDVSFQVKRGEVLGIIGKNGAGKSTLLKILSRTTEPTSGEITMRGRVSSLLEVGTGFNPELTGRENIYLNGAIIGMKKSEIKSKFDDIVEFAGIGEFLDTPVKRYSSGMYVRLAFSVAAHLDTDILIVDEVLSVGDAEFQKKCLGKMSSLARSGRTVILVSHNERAVLELCTCALYLKDGKVIAADESKKIIALYYKDMSSGIKKTFSGPLSENIQINKIIINDSKDKIVSLNPENIINIQVKSESQKKLPNIRITMAIYAGDIRILSMHDTLTSQDLNRGEFISNYKIPPNLLRPGEYDIYVGGYQEKTKDWFYGERLKKFIILPMWSDNNQEHNIGLINVTGETSRV